jgi:hypothetical protein
MSAPILTEVFAPRDFQELAARAAEFLGEVGEVDL